jgi:glycosyltransferase involved in cell wall biosynthesis
MFKSPKVKIVIFQPMLKAYRVPLFERLNQLLSDNGHELRIVLGMPPNSELERNDNVFLKTEYYIYNKSYWLFSNKVHILQDAIRQIIWADLIVTEQANKHLHNYLLILLSFFKFKPFAYWGHGLNRQGDSSSLSECIKKRLVSEADWWFAYTHSVADYLDQLGVSRQCISVLNNSIDTLGFKQDLAKLTLAEIEGFKLEYDIAADAQIGLFCGSLHKDKDIGFLLECSLSIRQKNSRFILLIGGEGVDKELVEQYSNQYDFIKYLGRLDGANKLLAFKCADVFLMPCMMGLAILDAFSASLPVLTTVNKNHSPEIDYLKSGFNGVITDFTTQSYAQTVLSVLASPFRLAALSENARASSEQFSIENMALNFAEGLEKFVAHHASFTKKTHC